MPNLSGIVDRRLSASEARSRNERQEALLDIPGIHFDRYRFAGDGCAFSLLDHGLLENGAQPVASQDGRYRMMLDGEIFNGDELRTRHGREAPVAGLSDPELCLWLYESFGKASFGMLNGLFALVVYDTRSGHLILATDRSGFRPVFYAVLGDSLVFGSEIKAIAALDDSKRLDHLGLLELFSFGQHIADRTWLSGYRKLPPATVLTFDGRNVDSEAYWRYAYDEDAPRLNQQSYFTVYRYKMDRAVERAMKGSRRIGIFLSGGYDSRAIAAAIRGYHLPIPSFTFGDPDSRDVRFAGQLAARLGFRHFSPASEEPYLRACCESVVWRTEGMLPFTSTTSMRFHPAMRGEMDIFLVGLLGEFGGSHTWPGLLAATRREQVISAMLHRLTLANSEAVRSVFQPGFLARMLPQLEEEFAATFGTIDNDKPLNIADSWRFQHFQHRGSGQAPSADRHLFEIRAPHMDTELVDFLLTIPPSARIEQRVYKKMIAYGFPAVRDIPCTNSAKPINPAFFAEYALMTLRFLGRRMTDPLRRRFSKRHLGREPGDLRAEMRAEPGIAEEFLFPLLIEDVFPGDVFDHDGIRDLVRDFYAVGRGNAHVVALLISFAVASRFFRLGDTDSFSRDLLAASPTVQGGRSGAEPHAATNRD